MKNILVLHLFSSRLCSFRALENCVSIQILIIAIIIISQREYITRLLYPLMLHIFNPIINTQLNILNKNKVHIRLKELDILMIDTMNILTLSIALIQAKQINNLLIDNKFLRNSFLLSSKVIKKYVYYTIKSYWFKFVVCFANNISSKCIHIFKPISIHD